MFKRVNMHVACGTSLILATAATCGGIMPAAIGQQSRTLASWTLASGCKVKDAGAAVLLAGWGWSLDECLFNLSTTFE